MKRPICVLLCVILLISSASALSYGTESFETDFCEEYFLSDSYEYSGELALLSLGLALSAFSERGDAPDRRIRSFLTEELGFSAYTSFRYDVPLTDSSDKVAVAFAAKSAGEYTVVAVALRGGDYGNEWSSNFDTGSEGIYGPYHKGFYMSALSVVPLLKAYMEENGHSASKTKLWISGYSRSAAVANLLSLLVRVNGLCLGENIYAYTFATPATAQLSFRDPDLANIFNIIYPFDPVPRVPFASWGFGRLGTDMLLPASGDSGAAIRLVSALSGAVRTRGEYVSSLQRPIMSAVCGDPAPLYALVNSALGGAATAEGIVAAVKSGSALLIASQLIAVGSYLSNQPADAPVEVRVLRAVLPSVMELAAAASPLSAFAGHDPALYIRLLLTESPERAADTLPDFSPSPFAYAAQQRAIAFMRTLCRLCA